MFEIARHNGICIPYTDVDEVHAVYDLHNLQSLLDTYYAAAAALLHERGLYDLTHTYLLRCRENSVVRVKIFFGPQAHTARGVAFGAVLNGIHRVYDSVHKGWGMNSVPIIYLLRHLPEEDAFKMLTQAAPYRGHIIGVGLDSSEIGHPLFKFQGVFAATRQAGSPTVTCTGEEGLPEYVYGALDSLKVSRIDHGVRSEEDATLMRRLIWEKTPLMVRPLNNLKLRVVNSLSEHNLRHMLQNSVLVMVNSDGPAYFGGYINQNFVELATAFDLTENDIRTLCKNSFAASFLNSEEKAAWRTAVDSCLT